MSTKIGTMPAFSESAPLPGVSHFGTKLASAPKMRQNILNVRVAPLKRLTAQVKPVKPDKFGNF